MWDPWRQYSYGLTEVSRRWTLGSAHTVVAGAFCLV
jgi:hypothetical protein